MIETNNRKVYIFKQPLKRLETMGLKPNKRLLNRRVLRYVVVYCVGIFSSSMYVVLDANTFWTYTNSIFHAVALVFGALLFLILTVQSKKLFQLRDDINKIVEASAYFVYLSSLCSE